MGSPEQDSSPASTGTTDKTCLGVFSNTVGMGQPPLALFSSLYPYKGCPQANHPVGMIAVLHWLLNKVQRLSGRTLVCHGQKHTREPLQGPLGSSVQKHVLFNLLVQIQSEKMQWVGELRGKFPLYIVPSFNSKDFKWQGASLQKIWLYPFSAVGPLVMINFRSILSLSPALLNC